MNFLRYFPNVWGIPSQSSSKSASDRPEVFDSWFDRLEYRKAWPTNSAGISQCAKKSFTGQLQTSQGHTNNNLGANVTEWITGVENLTETPNSDFHKPGTEIPRCKIPSREVVATQNPILVYQ